MKFALPDLRVCAQLVQTLTDELASSTARPATSAPINQIINAIRSISAQAEQRLRAKLAQHYPQVRWIGEDQLVRDASGWLFDPIDGAYHFIQGLPLWSSALVLLQEGEPLLSVVYDPVLRELFTAEIGRGVFLNEQPLHVSRKTALDAAVIGTAIAPQPQVGSAQHAASLELFSRIARHVFVVRPMAATSLQLAYVAAGRLDAYCENGCDAGDWMGGILLIREAGGTVSDFEGQDMRKDGILAAAPLLHTALLPIIQSA